MTRSPLYGEMRRTWLERVLRWMARAGRRR